MFSKKIIVLKQTADGYSTGNKPACGICRLEKENAILTVYLSLIGFTALSHGEYRLYIVADDKTVTDRVLGKIPNSLTFSEQSDLRIDKGVSVGIWTVKDDLPLLIAYAVYISAAAGFISQTSSFQFRENSNTVDLNIRF